MARYDCTRYRALRLYRQLNQMSSLALLGELPRGFPFPIRKLQCDNGYEFPLAFGLEVMRAGIAHRYIRPRRPQQKMSGSALVGMQGDWL